jgi:hypothetical protein
MTALPDVTLARLLMFVMNVMSTSSWLMVLVRNAAVIVNSVLVKNVILVMKDGSLTLLVFVLKSVKMETMLMRKLVTVLYAMMPVPSASVLRLKNVLHVSTVTSLLMALTDVISVMPVVLRAMADPMKSVSIVTQTSSYKLEPIAWTRAQMPNMEIRKLGLVKIVIRLVLYALEKILWNAQPV